MQESTKKTTVNSYHRDLYVYKAKFETGGIYRKMKYKLPQIKFPFKLKTNIPVEFARLCYRDCVISIITGTDCKGEDSLYPLHFIVSIDNDSYIHGELLEDNFEIELCDLRLGNDEEPKIYICVGGEHIPFEQDDLKKDKTLYEHKVLIGHEVYLGHTKTSLYHNNILLYGCGMVVIKYSLGL